MAKSQIYSMQYIEERISAQLKTRVRYDNILYCRSVEGVMDAGLRLQLLKCASYILVCVTTNTMHADDTLKHLE